VPKYEDFKNGKLTGIANKRMPVVLKKFKINSERSIIFTGYNSIYKNVCHENFNINSNYDSCGYWW
jgi:hypothetical protein